ncbi:hypothetical protein U4E84_09055 [Halorubrum sp. AD140]|uniref:DUF7544 domain-containing protein n=1 Tax=Halorubrum sp. AD140 TaxID=3050073 RepID=UPI002ACC4AB6|nr:hypothetical protein [Halorubrum sp. AD140]MDZ5811491.1 hypothetical protein [Halorubrum sp. AD140]
MSWDAVDAVDDAVEATRRFLFPFRPVRWTKLAFLVLVMGGSGASATVSLSAVIETEFARLQGIGLDGAAGDVGSAPGGVAGDAAPGGVAGDLVGAFDGGVLVVLAAVALSLVSLSFRLVFYDALRTNDVWLWRPFLSRLRQSVGLLAVSATLGAAATAPPVVAVLVALAGDVSIDGMPTDPELIDQGPIGVVPVEPLVVALGSLSTGSVAFLGLAGAAFVAVAVLALRLTYEFVVPTMIVEETGVLGGWRRLSMTLRAAWTEVIVYLLVHAFVSLGLFVVEGVAAVLVLSLVVAVAGALLLLVAAALGGIGALAGTTAGLVAIAVVATLSVLTLLVFALPVWILTRSYRISYEVSTLGGIDPELTLLHPDLDSVAGAISVEDAASAGGGAAER